MIQGGQNTEKKQIVLICCGNVQELHPWGIFKCEMMAAGDGPLCLKDDLGCEYHLSCCLMTLDFFPVEVVSGFGLVSVSCVQAFLCHRLMMIMTVSYMISS